jgi:hypothetical protein
MLASNRRPRRPLAPSLQRFALPGALMSFAELQEAAALNRSISPTYAQIDAACRRVENIVDRGKPRDVRIHNDSLGLA